MLNINKLMDPSSIRLRSGLIGDIDDVENDEFLAKTMGLISVFSQEALETAAMYAIGNGKKEVTDDDMSKALKFQARMFFQRVDDLEGRGAEATEEFLNAETDDESGEESEEEYEEESEYDSDSEASLSGEELETHHLDCKRIVPQVNAIVKSWNSYNPTAVSYTHLTLPTILLV